MFCPLSKGIAEEVIPATFKKVDKNYELDNEEGPRKEGGRGRGRGRGGAGRGQVYLMYIHRVVSDAEEAEGMMMEERKQPKKASPRRVNKIESQDDPPYIITYTVTRIYIVYPIYCTKHVKNTHHSKIVFSNISSWLRNPSFKLITSLRSLTYSKAFLRVHCYFLMRNMMTSAAERDRPCAQCTNI